MDSPLSFFALGFSGTDFDRRRFGAWQRKELFFDHAGAAKESVKNIFQSICAMCGSRPSIASREADRVLGSAPLHWPRGLAA